MRKPYHSPGWMKNSSYYIAPAGDRTHDLPHTVASNTVKVSHTLNHSATEAVQVGSWSDISHVIVYFIEHGCLLNAVCAASPIGVGLREV